MSWVKEAKSQLHKEGMCRVRPIGGSMKGAIESGQLVTMVKTTGEEVLVGDAIFIRWKGNYILHLVKEIAPAQLLIGNNLGKINGWIDQEAVIAKVTEVEGRPFPPQTIPFLKGRLITLRPAAMSDRKPIYQWLAHSNLTQEMMGPPHFSDHSIPTWEEFTSDYLAHYFDGSKPMLGRCFVIEREGQGIGQINYNAIDPEEGSTEIDIWLSDRLHTGKGYGTEAILLLCHYLKVARDCRKIYIAPSARNARAIRAYKKAGFFQTDQVPADFAADYEDVVVLMKPL